MFLDHISSLWHICNKAPVELSHKVLASCQQPHEVLPGWLCMCKHHISKGSPKEHQLLLYSAVLPAAVPDLQICPQNISEMLLPRSLSSMVIWWMPSKGAPLQHWIRGLETRSCNSQTARKRTLTWQYRERAKPLMRAPGHAWEAR